MHSYVHLLRLVVLLKRSPGELGFKGAYGVESGVAPSRR